MSRCRETLAIGRDGEVRIWCTGTEKRFSVINGGWNGRLKDGLVYIAGDQKPTANGEVLWRGVVPAEHAGDYNTAIAWIRQEIAAGR